MKKALLIASLFALVMVVGVTQATADQQFITITATLAILSIDIDPSVWALGFVSAASETTTNFDVTNTGNVNEDLTIQTNPGAGLDWACGVGKNPDQFGMESSVDGGQTWTSTCLPGITLGTNIAVSATVNSQLKFIAPLRSTSTAQQVIRVWVTASLAV